jgi:omega-hydroxy-beta-dihydromenaquinone-9 sulfotransferase
MSQETQFRKYLAFSADEGATPSDQESWSQAFIYLMKKLTLRHQLLSKGYKQRLLVKSPIHTARIPLLRKLFPRARFIHIHRHPYEVFQSAAHMADTAYWFCYLNTPTNEQVLEFIMWQFSKMWEEYSAAAYGDVTVSSDGSIHANVLDDVLDVAYTDLIGDNSLKTLQNIYKHIQVPWEDILATHFVEHYESLRSYSPNRHTVIPADLKSEVRRRWSGYFERFSYRDELFESMLAT